MTTSETWVRSKKIRAVNTGRAGEILVLGSHAPIFVESCYSNGYDSLWNGKRTGSALSSQGEGWLCVQLLMRLG